MIDPSPLHTALIAWFKTHREDLPWRHTGDPYAVWVSEIMLQQTQVATVIPYFEQFMAQFPTVEALAAAPLDKVLKQWEGLGYYSRARNLHRAARMVVEQFGGKLPANVVELEKLPGIGLYTAGAIGSLAFGLDVPVVDGNIIRVLTRLYNIEDDITQSATRRELWNLAGEIVPTGQAASWNEGLMELGRRICMPRSPDCENCPLIDHCEAHQRNVQHERPVRSARKAVPHVDVTAAVIRENDGKVLIAQRREDDMLGGLWEFPGGKREKGESLEGCLRREIREELGIEIVVGQQLTTIKHAYTHFKITLHVFECRRTNGEPQAIECADWAWATLDELDRYAFPVTDQKIIATLRDGSGQFSMDLST
ncbi:MAG: A/G-specific adenine glycosylase [Anaerolineae bacterium]|nr:A/G-specific adenine glycosylase [Anaerolineae bacterium]